MKRPKVKTHQKTIKNQRDQITELKTNNFVIRYEQFFMCGIEKFIVFFILPMKIDFRR